MNFIFQVIKLPLIALYVYQRLCIKAWDFLVGIVGGTLGSFGG